MMAWKMIIRALFAVAVNGGRKKRKLWTKGMKEWRSQEAAVRLGRNEGGVNGLEPARLLARGGYHSSTCDLDAAARSLAGGCVLSNADETVQEMPLDTPHVHDYDHPASPDSEPVLQALPQATEESDLDGAAQPSGGTRHVGGMSIFFQQTQLTGAPARVVELFPSATVLDLVIEVERQTRVPTAVFFRGQLLDDKDAQLSDLQIGSESLVHTHPIIWICKVQFEDFSVNSMWIDLNKFGVPTEDRVIDVEYHGVLCPITWLFDYLRDALIRKLQDRQWDQALTEGARRLEDGQRFEVEDLHGRFDNALARGDKFVFSETTAKNMISSDQASTALDYLQQHRIAIDSEELQQMISDLTSAHEHNIVVSCTILD